MVFILFHVQFSDDNNTLTNVQSHFFLKDWNESGIAQIRKVSKYQYWIDQNSAQRVKRNLSPTVSFSWEELIPLDALSNGVHTFHVQFSDYNNTLTNVQSHFFVKDKDENGTMQVRKLNKYEYWTDNDTTQRVQKNLTAKENFSWEEQIDLPTLSNGAHIFHVRFADNKGKWTNVQSQFFVKDNESIQLIGNNLINGYRIWFDDEPDFFPTFTHATTTAITEMTDSIHLGYLPKGKHAIFFQFKDTKGVWSTVFTDSVEQKEKPFFSFSSMLQQIKENEAVAFSPVFKHFIDSIMWSYGDGTTEVAFEPMHTYVNEGEYDVTATVWHRGSEEGISYTEIKYIKVLKALGVNNLTSFGIRLFPIPVDNTLTILCESAKMRTIQISTLSGSKVLIQKCSGNATEVINVEHLSPGNYIVVIETDKGIISTKVLKN